MRETIEGKSNISTDSKRVVVSGWEQLSIRLI